MDLPCTQVLEDNDESSFSKPSGTLQKTPKRVYQVATLMIGKKNHPIFKGINKVGRNPGNDICIQDITVSKAHAEIEADAKLAFICDLRSSNKTRMNNEILRPERFYQLVDGSKLTFGVVNGTYLVLRDNDESIIVPETPDVGLKLRNDQNKDSSAFNISNGDSDESVILGTQQAQDEDGFAKPLAPGRSANTKDVIRNAKRSSNSSDKDTHDEETQRIFQSTESQNSIHDSSTQRIHFSDVNTSIHDVETQKIDVGPKKKIMFDLETQHCDEDDGHNMPTQKLDIGKGKRIHNIETKRIDRNNDEDDDDLYSAATQKLDDSRKKNVYDMETQRINEDSTQNIDVYGAATQKLDDWRKKNVHDMETQRINEDNIQNIDVYGAATQKLDDWRKMNVHDMETQRINEDNIQNIDVYGAATQKLDDWRKKNVHDTETQRLDTGNSKNVDIYGVETQKIDNRWKKNVQDLKIEGFDADSIQNVDIYGAATQKLDNRRKRNVHDIETQRIARNDDNDDDDLHTASTQKLNNKRTKNVHDVETQRVDEKSNKNDNLYGAETQHVFDKKKPGIHDVETQVADSESADIVKDSDGENNEDDDKPLPLKRKAIKQAEEAENNRKRRVHDEEQSEEAEKVSMNKNYNDRNDVTKKRGETKRHSQNDGNESSTSAANQSSYIIEETDDEFETDDEGYFASFLQKETNEICNIDGTIDATSNDTDLHDETTSNDDERGCPSPVLANIEEMAKSTNVKNNDDSKHTNEGSDSDNEIFITPNQITSPLKSESHSDLAHSVHSIKFPNKIKHTDAEIDYNYSEKPTSQVLPQKQLNVNENNVNIVSDAEVTQSLIETQILDAAHNDLADMQIANTQMIKDTLIFSKKQSETQRMDLADTLLLNCGPTQIMDTQMLNDRPACDDKDDQLSDDEVESTQLIEKCINISFRRGSRWNRSNDNDASSSSINDSHHRSRDKYEEGGDDVDPTQILEVKDKSANYQVKEVSQILISDDEDDPRTQKLESVKNELSKTNKLEKGISINNKDYIDLGTTDDEDDNESKIQKSKIVGRSNKSKIDDENRSNDDEQIDSHIAPTQKIKDFNKESKKPSKMLKKNQVSDDSTDDEPEFSTPVKIQNKIPAKSAVLSSGKKISLSLNQNTKKELQKMMEKSQEIKQLRSLNKSDDTHDKNEINDKDEISETLNEMFGEPMNEAVDLPPPLLTQQLVDILKSPQSVRISHENLINYNDFQCPESQESEKGIERKGVNLSAGNSVRDEESQEVYFANLHSTRKKHAALNSQSSSGSEKSSKLRKRSSNAVTDEPGVSGFIDGVVVISQESVTVPVSPNKRTKSNGKIKGTKSISTRKEVKGQGTSKANADTDGEADDELTELPKTRLVGRKLHRSNSTSSTGSSVDDFVPSDMSKALKDRCRLARIRSIGVDIEAEPAPLTKETKRDSILGSDDSDLSNDEDLTFEGLKKMADKFLTKDIKKNIFREENRRKKKSTSEDSEADVLVKSKRVTEKNKDITKGNEIINKTFFEKPVGVVRKPGRPKKNPDLVIGKEDKKETKETKETEPEVKKRGRIPKNLEYPSEREESKKVSKKKPEKLKQSAQIMPRSSSSSSVESHEVKSIMANNKKEVPRKRPAAQTSPSLLGNTMKKQKLVGSLNNTLNSSSRNDIRRQSIRTQKHNVIFTGMAAERYIKSIKNLGGTITDDPAKATVLVTDKVRRTFKFLCAISRSIPIVSIKWVEESSRKHEFLDTDRYILRDEASEIKYDFELRDSLRKSSEHLLLKGYTFIISPKVCNGQTTELKNMIQIAGGKALVRVSKTWLSTTIIIGCEEDIPKVKEWIAKTPKNLSVPVVTTEFVFSGILKQNLNYEDHGLEI